MKKLISVLGFCLASLITTTSFASEWLEGVYINQDEGSSMNEVIFCKVGKAYAGMSPRQYTISREGDFNHVILNSNGTFKFKVSLDKTELFPADKFTTDWFTKSSLKLDPKRSDTCNW